MIASPMVYNYEIRQISKILYAKNGTVRNTIDYMTAMPTLDYVISVSGSKGSKKSLKERAEKTLTTIRHTEIIRDALRRGMIEGVAFYYFETKQRPLTRKKTMTNFDVESIVEINDDDQNVSIISLPTDYTKIVGIKNSAYQLAFNLEYFTRNDFERAENKVKKYPQEIRNAFEKWQNNKLKGNWIVLNNKNTIVHKISSLRSEPWGRPLALAAFDDIDYRDYFKNTKRAILDEVNNKVVYQTFPEGKEKGLSALTKKQQKEQHDSVKIAIQNKNSLAGVSFFSVAAGTKLDALQVGNTELFDKNYESDIQDDIALDLGISGSLLNGVGSGSYASQVNNLELIGAEVFEWIEQIAAELNKCINENVIKSNTNKIEVNYLPITRVNKDKMVSFAKELYTSGKGSLSLWASACGVKTDTFFALLDQELEDGIEDKYPIHQTSYTLSNKSSDGGSPGRPKTDNPSDNTIASQSNNGDSIPSPSD